MVKNNKLKEYERVLKHNIYSFLKFLFAWSIKGIKITDKEVHEALEFANAMNKGNIESNEHLTLSQKEKKQKDSDLAFEQLELHLKENVLKSVESEISHPTY